MFVSDRYREEVETLKPDEASNSIDHDDNFVSATPSRVRPLFLNVQLSQDAQLNDLDQDTIADEISQIDGLSVSDGKLLIDDANAMRRVRSFLKDCGLGESYREVVVTDTRKWPLLLEFRACSVWIDVRIVDIGAPISLDRDALFIAFDLTDTEVRIGELIANGAKPSEIAELKEIAVSTVRTHMKSLFSKTRAGNQLELALLLSHFRISAQ